MRPRFLHGSTLFLVLITLGGCGLSVPEKSPFRSEANEVQASYEDQIVQHVYCEIKVGLTKASKLNVPWLKEWGTAITLSITSQDQSGINAGASIISPFANFTKSYSNGIVTIPQMFSLGIGGTVASNATRNETIQFTYLNSDLINETTKGERCDDYQTGVMIDGNLKIEDFIYDKSVVADTGNATGHAPRSWPIYNTFSEEIVFLASYGGSLTPSWKLARLSTNATSPLLAGQKTYTNDLIITIGPVKYKPSAKHPTELGQAAQFQHNAKVQASAIATSIQSQSH